MKDIIETKKNTSSILTLIFAALIAISSFVSIKMPTTPIQLILQNMMPILAGCTLGGIQGAGATGLFLVAGSLGLPIFAGGNAGIDHLSTSTGGYIIGYFFASLVSGLLASRPKKDETITISKIAIAGITGFIIVYAIGTLQFIHTTKVPFQESLSKCIFPFLPYDAAKLAITVFLSVKLRPIIAQYIH